MMKFLGLLSVSIFALTASNIYAKDWNKVDKCNPDKAACQLGLYGVIEEPNLSNGKVVFDFDTDGCLASAPVVRNGTSFKVNPGTKNTGALDGQCAYRDQLQRANILFKEICSKNNKEYCVRIFALYTVKDMAAAGAWDPFGHKHDFEHAVLWMKSNNVEYVGTSNHGNLTNTKAKDFPRLSANLFDTENFNTFTVVYHKHGARTHALRKSKSKIIGNITVTTETPENPEKKWVLPNIININDSKLDPGYLNVVNNGDWGDAKLELKESRIHDFIQAKRPKEWKDSKIDF